mmetsp:Transcript_10719/g.21337  ORF Transcript_10719/g.21337 Transcript_10719/m.21337 type:complete len:316 (-) Transcript_10719:70-1017(-)
MTASFASSSSVHSDGAFSAEHFRLAEVGFGGVEAEDLDQRHQRDEERELVPALRQPHVSEHGDVCKVHARQSVAVEHWEQRPPRLELGNVHEQELVLVHAVGDRKVDRPAEHDERRDDGIREAHGDDKEKVGVDPPSHELGSVLLEAALGAGGGFVLLHSLEPGHPYKGPQPAQLKRQAEQGFDGDELRERRGHPGHARPEKHKHAPGLLHQLLQPVRQRPRQQRHVDLDELKPVVPRQHAALHLGKALRPLVPVVEGREEHGEQRHEHHLQQHGQLRGQKHVLVAALAVLVVVGARVALQPLEARQVVELAQVA